MDDQHAVKVAVPSRGENSTKNVSECPSYYHTNITEIHATWLTL